MTSRKEQPEMGLLLLFFFCTLLLHIPNLLSLIGTCLVVGGALLKIYLRKHFLSQK